ncbi:MAG TPA: permease-like cell division protein FtsX [Streptosporangiaceae bacterium]|jgi:cell division transport system permease protein
MRAQFVLHEVWVGLRRNLTMTIAVIATVAISLALGGTGMLIQNQVGSMKDYWDGKIEVSVFLCVDSSPNPACKGNVPVPQSEKDQIKQRLQSLPQVEHVYYESQQQAYERFKEKFKNTPEFVKVTQPQFLPDSFRVKLKDPKQFAPVEQAIQSQKGVDLVNGKNETTERFLHVLSGLQIAAIVVALLQLMAAILLIANTIRLAAYNRRRETGIMRLVGSSNLYIQLPFLLEGAIAGLVGAVIASGLLAASKVFLFDKIQHYMGSSNSLAWSDVIMTIVLCIVVGIVLCVAASAVTIRRYLRV